MAEAESRRHSFWVAAVVVVLIVIVKIAVESGTDEQPESEPRPTTTGEAPLKDAKPGEGVKQRTTFKYDGPMPTTFQEAPMLAKRVQEGKLPPVAERLPAEPLVTPTVERIGEYGGTWRRAFTGPVDGQNIDRIIHDHVLYYDLDGMTIVPHIAKAWEMSADGRALTLRLRKGMKWSDGHPFTADDFVFAYNGIILNKTINPNPPAYLKSKGKMGRMVKVDDYTVRHEFDDPYYVLPELYASNRLAGQFLRGRFGRAMYAPAHYLRQFHPSVIPEATLTKMARDSGLRNWVEMFRLKSNALMNTELPVVGAWKTIRPISEQLFVLERNEYYWAVDQAGNQLPYVDTIRMKYAGNIEVLNLSAIAGEIDMQGRHVLTGKLPLLKREGVKNEYRVLLWPSTKTTLYGVTFNQTWRGDPEIEKWLQNREFRVALAYAIDREEIRESIFLGAGQIKDCVPNEGTPFDLGRNYDRKYAILDRKRSNEMLDRLGLTKKDDEGFRQRTDGKGRLILEISMRGNAFMDSPGASELVARHWAKVGVKLKVSVEERSHFETKRAGNNHQLTVGGGTGAGDLWTVYHQVPSSPFCGYALGAGIWTQTGGKRGVEPTGDLKRLIEWYEEGKHVPLAKRKELGKTIWRTMVDNMYTIGIVGRAPSVVVVKNNFRNVPDVAPNYTTVQTPGPARPEQFFFAGQ